MARQTHRALAKDNSPIRTKAVRQPQVPPIQAAMGMPRTDATDQPRNTMVIARPRWVGGTSKPTQAAAWGVKIAAGMTARIRSGSRALNPGKLAHTRCSAPYQAMDKARSCRRSQLRIRVANTGAPRHTISAAADISWPAVAVEICSEWLMSFRVPGTTMMPVPITKLPNSSAHRDVGKGACGAGAVVMAYGGCTHQTMK